jgi:hypothetical protein
MTTNENVSFGIKICILRLSTKTQETCAFGDFQRKHNI